MSAPDPLACALAIVAAMSLAGLVHACWMASHHSASFRIPIDGGRWWRGTRIFGDNKTLAGFMAITPAAGAAFALLGAVRETMPAWIDAGLWPLTAGELFALGCWAGFWFMAGELPNSFLKRRLGLSPGTIPRGGWPRLVCLLLDRIDSVLALLIALAVLMPMHWSTWLWVLAIGPAVHLAFSSVLFLTGVKARAA